MLDPERPKLAQESAIEKETRLGWRMTGLGVETAAQVAAGALLGWLVDRWLNTRPTGLLIGAILGIVVGLTSLIRGAIKLNRSLPTPTGFRKADQTNAAGSRAADKRDDDKWEDKWDDASELDPWNDERRNT